MYDLPYARDEHEKHWRGDEETHDAIAASVQADLEAARIAHALAVLTHLERFYPYFVKCVDLERTWRGKSEPLPIDEFNDCPF